MLIDGSEILQAAACLTLVCSSLFCAFVRYFHMCRPFAGQESYFYPARKLMTLIYAGFAMPVVWLFRFNSPDAWLFVRVFLVLFLPGAGTFAFRCYFFSDIKRPRLQLFLWGLIPVAAILVLWIFAWKGGDVLHRHSRTVLAAVGVYSLFCTIALANTTLWLCSQIRRRSRETYSNEDDFPLRFAGSVAFMPLTYVAAAWVLFFTGNRTYNMWLQFLVSLMHVILLVRILHPQRKEYKEVVEDTENIMAGKIETVIAEQKSGGTALTETFKDELEAKIHTALKEQKLYLNPNFKISELADAVKSNKKYVSIVMNERCGSFYTEVNRLRIEAAAEYKQAHPAASREEVATHSGFSNVKTYSRNLKSISIRGNEGETI